MENNILSGLLKLELLKAMAIDCNCEGVNVGDIIAVINLKIEEVHKELRWSCVLLDGVNVYEGTEWDCAEYAHQQNVIHGKCEIKPLYKI